MESYDVIANQPVVIDNVRGMIPYESIPPALGLNERIRNVAVSVSASKSIK